LPVSLLLKVINVLLEQAFLTFFRLWKIVDLPEIWDFWRFYLEFWINSWVFDIFSLILDNNLLCVVKNLLRFLTNLTEFWVLDKKYWVFSFFRWSFSFFTLSLWANVQKSLIEPNHLHWIIEKCHFWGLCIKNLSLNFFRLNLQKKTYSQHPRTIAILRRTPIAEIKTLSPAMFFGSGGTRNYS